MHWVVCAKVQISDEQEINVKRESSHWWLFAWLHMYFLEMRLAHKYVGHKIFTWMDYKV